MILSCYKNQSVGRKINIPLMLLLFLSVLFHACGGSNDDKGVSTTSNSGALYITDDLNTDYHQVIATIYKVEVEKTSDGTRLLIFNDQDGETYDLRNLSGILAKLRGASIPVGNYNRVIITVGNKLILVGDDDIPITPNPEFSSNTFTSCSGEKCTIEIPGAVNVAVREKVIVDFDLKQFKYDPDTNRVTAKVVIDAGGSKYRDYVEMKDDDYELKGIISDISSGSFELILKRARHFMPERNIVTVLVDSATQYSCDDDDNVEDCQFSSFDDLETGMKVEIDGHWNGLTFEAENVELDEDNDLPEGKTDEAEDDDDFDGEDDGDGSGAKMHSRFGWTDADEQHRDYVAQNSISDCMVCHNIIEDRSNPLSCYKCHDNLWDAGGDEGGNTVHSSFGWTDADEQHRDYVVQNNISDCTGCHNIIENQNNLLSCYKCHGNLWDKNDGSPGHYGWSNVAESHQDWAKNQPIDECLACHNTSLSDSENPMSCYYCHGRKW